MTTRDLRHDIGAADADETELQIALGDYFRGSTTDANGTTFGADSRLALRSRPTGSFTIEAGPNFDHREIPAIRDAVEVALDQASPRVFTTFAFTDLPVQGSYAAPDGSWRILPPPSHAPTATVAGAPQPLVVELRVDASPNLGVTNYRVERERRRWLAVVQLVGRTGRPLSWLTELPHSQDTERLHQHSSKRGHMSRSGLFDVFMYALVVGAVLAGTVAIFLVAIDRANRSASPASSAACCSSP